MIAKVIYFNWDKARKEDDTYKNDKSLVSVTWTGELLTDRPDLYDSVDKVDYPDNIAKETMCDVIFRSFNRVEEGDMAGMRIRSMSVGDAVVFDDGKLFVVQGCGWKEIKGESLKFWALPKVEEQTS